MCSYSDHHSCTHSWRNSYYRGQCNLNKISEMFSAVGKKYVVYANTPECVSLWEKNWIYLNIELNNFSFPVQLPWIRFWAPDKCPISQASFISPLASASTCFIDSGHLIFVLFKIRPLSENIFFDSLGKLMNQSKKRVIIFSWLFTKKLCIL